MPEEIECASYLARVSLLSDACFSDVHICTRFALTSLSDFASLSAHLSTSLSPFLSHTVVPS